MPCGDERARDRDPQVDALRNAYRGGRLVVSADAGALARARLHDGHAIDARDVAEAMLRELLRGSRKRSRPGRGH